MTDILRDVDLATLSRQLQSQRVRSVDLVMPAGKVEFASGRLVVQGLQPVAAGEPEIPGVEATRPSVQVDGVYGLSTVAVEGVADKLGIPLAYLRRMLAERTDLADANANGWLRRDPRKFLLRLLRAESPDPTQPRLDVDLSEPDGTLRAFLSNGYRCIDNLDVVLAALQGIGDAHGPDGLSVRADLTERRMYVRVTSERISANARALVRDYRDPGSGRFGRDYPLAFAGFVLSNSEVGDGRFTITPRVVLQVCTNGQTITKDALARTHIGGRLEEGVIEWSDVTQQRNLALVTSQTSDAVRTFLSASYVDAKVAQLAAAAGIEVADPSGVVEQVSKRLGFTVQQQVDILAAFTKGADATAGGVMHAVTYVAQHAADGDTAAGLEAAALPALELAATLAR